MNGPGVLEEGSLRFTFEIPARKYDDWAFYRNRINVLAGGAKAVDFLALGNDELWLVEVKDYRVHPRTKPSALPQEIAEKVRDTLAGLVCVAFNGLGDDEH